MPGEIRKTRRQGSLQEPKVIELAHSTPAETIEHALYPVATSRKVELLEHLFGGDDFSSAIVFSRTKHRAKRLADQLNRTGHNAVALQGNMSQGQRDRAMKGFRTGHFSILVATDIAARGIDVAGVSHVINFDVPGTPDAYTHRIGRTGRAECTGKAYTLIAREDAEQVRAIEKKLGVKIERREVNGFGPKSGDEARYVHPPRGGGRNGRSRTTADASAAPKKQTHPQRRTRTTGSDGAGPKTGRRRRRGVAARAS